LVFASLHLLVVTSLSSFFFLACFALQSPGDEDGRQHLAVIRCESISTLSYYYLYSPLLYPLRDDGTAQRSNRLVISWLSSAPGSTAFMTMRHQI
jgi:hypothetical protein